jgi:hypothetical protein
LIRYKCKHTALLLEDVIRDFQNRIEKTDSGITPPQFSDDELEQLLGG